MGVDEHREFEERYRQLRAAGAAGWGGEGFGERQQVWRRALAHLEAQGRLPPAGARVLELGSGSGMVSAMFVALGCAVEGIDVSETAVAWASQEVSAARFVVGDAADLSRWADGSFDLVVDGNCLHCMLDEGRGRCLSEVQRVLGEEGKLLVSSMVEPVRNLPTGTALVDGFLLREGPRVRRVLAREALREERRGAGFAVELEHVVERA
ncbi:MAG: class I SAM-dependent methyltransferase, partial [Myxococcota bacterium]